MTRFSNDSLQLHGVLNGTNMSAALTLRCLGALTHAQGIQTIGPDTGAPYQETRFIGERRPEISATAMAVRSVLDTLSLLGQNCMTAAEGLPGVQAFLQSHSPCAVNGRTAGSNHRRITVAKCHLLVTQVGGSRGSSATVQLRVVELSTDGQATPEAIVDNAALPSTFVADQEFVICEPRVGNILIAPDHVLGWSIETGVDLTVIVPAGSIYATAVDVVKVTPRITVQHDDPTLLGSSRIPENGLACTHANTVFPLQKRSPLGGLVARDQTEHIKITAAGYAHHAADYNASGRAVGTGELTVECIEGVGGVPLTVSTGVALTTI